MSVCYSCVTSFSGFVLSKCPQPRFVVFPPVFMARVDDASDRPVPSPVQLSSSNFGSLNGSFPDIDGLATRPGTSSDEKFDGHLSKLAHFDVHLAQFPVLQNLTSRMESHVTTTLGGFAARLAEKGQHFSASQCTHVQDRNKCSFRLQCLRLGKILALT